MEVEKGDIYVSRAGDRENPGAPRLPDRLAPGSQLGGRAWSFVPNTLRLLVVNGMTLLANGLAAGYAETPY